MWCILQRRRSATGSRLAVAGGARWIRARAPRLFYRTQLTSPRLPLGAFQLLLEVREEFHSLGRDLLAFYMHAVELKSCDQSPACGYARMPPTNSNQGAGNTLTVQEPSSLVLRLLVCAIVATFHPSTQHLAPSPWSSIMGVQQLATSLRSGETKP